MDEEIVHIQWHGPFSFQDALGNTDTTRDYGIYQVCGPHPAYGRDVLLYLGKASKQTFGRRLLQEGWEGWQKDRGAVHVFLGRLHGSETPVGPTWNDMISRTERLLILAHRPAHNSKGLYREGKTDLQRLHILNWGDRGTLLPEVTGSRWTSRFRRIPNYGPFGSHNPAAHEPEEQTSSTLDDDAAELLP